MKQETKVNNCQYNTKNTCEFQKSGFFGVLDKNYDELRKAYCATFETFLKSANNAASFAESFAVMLYKASRKYMDMAGLLGSGSCNTVAPGCP